MILNHEIYMSLKLNKEVELLIPTKVNKENVGGFVKFSYSFLNKLTNFFITAQ